MVLAMTNATPDYYPDPYDPEIFRQWDGEVWTPFTRTGPDAEPVRLQAPHVGRSVSGPGQPVAALPSQQAPPTYAQIMGRPATATSAATKGPSGAALTVAIGWLIVAAIVGIKFIAGAQHEAYGGDAYTGIQNTGADTVRALGWLIIATGPIGLIVALSRR